MLYKLKPITWNTTIVNNQPIHVYDSPSHRYTIRLCLKEKQYAIYYLNKSTQEPNIKYLKDIESAKKWVEETHIPAKLAKWFIPQ